jgi:hypothetical protein
MFMECCVIFCSPWWAPNVRHPWLRLFRSLGCAQIEYLVIRCTTYTHSVFRGILLHRITSRDHGQVQGTCERRMASARGPVCIAQDMETGSQGNSNRQEERPERREAEPRVQTAGIAKRS